MEQHGSGTVVIKTSKTDFDRRFCALQIIGRVTQPQNNKFTIIFKGKPSADDPTIPANARLRREIELYDERVILLWDPKGYLNDQQVDYWYEDFKKNAYEGKEASEDKILIQIDGYKVLLKTRHRNRESTTTRFGVENEHS